MASTGSGVIVLTSSSGRELSVEKPDWENGAFTEAVLEALDGRGNADDNDWLTVAELQAYVARRVRELTANQQTPAARGAGCGLLQRRPLLRRRLSKALEQALRFRDSSSRFTRPCALARQELLSDLTLELEAAAPMSHHSFHRSKAQRQGDSN